VPFAELNCQQLVELVSDYLEGALGPADVARFEGHIAACEGCREYLAQMRLTIQALGRLPEESIPPAAREELLTAFRTWRKS